MGEYILIHGVSHACMGQSRLTERAGDESITTTSNARIWEWGKLNRKGGLQQDTQS